MRNDPIGCMVLISVGKMVELEDVALGMQQKHSIQIAIRMHRRPQ